MSRSNSWTRHSYPVHPPHFERNPELSNGLDPIPDTNLPKPVPKFIRAVKDANTYKPKGRTIVICLDGTGDKFDSDNSNIVHVVSCLKKDDPSQVTYYQSGIGTYDGGGLSNGFKAAADMAVGSGLGVHVQDAYRFLMQTYKEGDKICLFGFSRGAYTCRCLAGMIHKVGLLPPHNTAQVPFAYQFYKDDSDDGWKMSEEFKKTFCTGASIYFMGVWDCVASVGFFPRKLPFSSTPTSHTKYFRHAMALDEHRSKFKICHWQRLDNKDEQDADNTLEKTAWEIEQGKQLNATPETAVEKPNGVKMNGISRRLSGLSAQNGHRKSSVSSIPASEDRDEDFKKKESEWEKKGRKWTGVATDVSEVYFMGCHADCGGGAVANEERHMLSRIPLRWMIRQSFECDTGLLFDSAKLAEKGLDVHMLWPAYKPLQKPVVGPSPTMVEKWKSGNLPPLSRRATALKSFARNAENEIKGIESLKFDDDEEKLSVQEAEEHWTSEQAEDYFDAMAPINDQLVQAKGWWILELWPIKVRIQEPDSDDWVKKVRMNLGRFRPIQETEPNLHWTVRQRMYDKGYKMRVRIDRNAVWRIIA